MNGHHIHRSGAFAHPGKSTRLHPVSDDRFFQKILGIFLHHHPHHSRSRNRDGFISDVVQPQHRSDRHIQDKLSVRIRKRPGLPVLRDNGHPDKRISHFIDDNADDLAGLAGRKRNLDLRSELERIDAGHGTGHGIVGHPLGCEGTQGNRRPTVRGNGIHTLVPDRCHRLDAGGGLQGKGQFRPGLGLVREGGESQRQVQGRANPMEFVVIFNGLAVFEIENVQAYRLRPVRRIIPFQGGQRTGLASFAGQGKHPAVKHFPIGAEHRDDDPFGAVRAAHPHPDLLTVVDFGGFRQEDPAHRRIQHGIFRPDLEDPAGLLVAKFLFRNRCRHFQIIDRAGRQRQFHHVTRLDRR